MNIRAYLQRINYEGALEPTAATLRDLHLAHLRTVPFENLDIHLGRPIVLERPALFHKIVTQRRGGFWYELNGLFAWLLQSLGFEVTYLAASDAHADEGYGPEFDHLTLQVRCPADPEPTLAWLADVGWGDSFSLPLKLDFTGEQEEGLRAYRLDHQEPYRLLWQRDYEGQWEKQYRFTLQPRQFAEFEPTCHYHQSSPESHFTQRRICTLATPQGRITLAEKRLIVTETGQRQERPVEPDEYDALLASQFGIKLEA
jgi:N-hydroxyarylamine O-acetyltransferase